MTEYDNTNRGALFQSEKKTEKHPDLKGPLNIEGTDYYVSAWSEVSKKDGKNCSRCSRRSSGNWR
jgi:hypothetical protein